MKKIIKQTFTLIFTIMVFFQILGATAYATVGDGYIIRSQNGLIAVFEADGSTLVHETEIPVDALPEYDQKRLSVGIALPDSTSLTKALENFCS